VESHAGFLMTASHTIYKERIYNLNDYSTIDRWTSKKTIKLAQELRIEDALKIAINFEQIDPIRILETPYNIPLQTWLAILTRKLRTDSLTRATSINMLKNISQ
jgi:hypothetical protein